MTDLDEYCSETPSRGWTEGSVRDLLDLSDDEAAIVEIRVRLAEKVREKRRARRNSTSAD